MDQASKVLKNFNLRAFAFKDLKNNKSLISSKLEICCEDHSIHLSTKAKKISCLSQVQRRQNQRIFFCKRIEIEIVLIIYQYKLLFANEISFQLFDFLQLRNFVFANFLGRSGSFGRQSPMFNNWFLGWSCKPFQWSIYPKSSNQAIVGSSPTGRAKNL